MASFATVEDLEGYLAITFNEAEESAQAQAMLDQATADMVEHMGRDITVSANDTVTLDPNNQVVLLLPVWPVTAVSAVVVDGTALTLPGDIYWYSDGRLYRSNGQTWGCKRQSVVVTYSHGEAVPSGLKGVCIARAARLMDNPTNVANESAGAVSVNYGLPPGEIFTDEEKALMGRTPVIA